MKVEHLQWNYGGIFLYILHEEGQITKPTFWWTSSVCPMHRLNGGQSPTLSSAQNDLYAEHKIFYIIGTKLFINIYMKPFYGNNSCWCFLLAMFLLLHIFPMKSAAKKELQDLRGLRFCLLFVDCDSVIALLSEHHLWLFFCFCF